MAQPWPHPPVMVIVAGGRGVWSRVWLGRGFGTPPPVGLGRRVSVDVGFFPAPPLWDGPIAPAGYSGLYFIFVLYVLHLKPCYI